MGSIIFLVLQTGPITKQRDTKRIEKTLNNAYTTTQKQTNNGFHNIQKTPQLWISGCSVITVYHSTGFSDFEGNDHGKGLMENLWLDFRCRSQKKNITFPLSSKDFAFYFFVFNW